MTKEEKKLFEKIKCKCGYGIRTQASFDVIEEMEGTKAKEKAIEYQGEVDFLIYLIEKLQKENRKLKQEQAKRNWIRVKENGEVVPMFYISKDKIRKNLKHCEEELEKINNGEEFEDERDFYDYAILIYKDLLEEG